MEKHLQIISRADAKRLGMKRYFTGLPCKRGHVAERLTSSGRCPECQKIHTGRWYRENRERNSDNVRRWYNENRDRVRENKRKWVEENKERVSESARAWRLENLERRREEDRRWYEENKERVKARSRAWRKENKDRARHNRRKWEEENKEKLAEKKRRYYQKNKERIAEQQRRKWATDPSFRMQVFMRATIRRSLTNKTDRTHRLLGYTAQDLREHIERQFTKGMSWDNYGEWHIDHIIPVAEYIRSGETDPAVINCLSNLRPLWADENLRKGDRVGTLL